jgi:hypothetical protein
MCHAPVFVWRRLNGTSALKETRNVAEKPLNAFIYKGLDHKKLTKPSHVHTGFLYE